MAKQPAEKKKERLQIAAAFLLAILTFLLCALPTDDLSIFNGEIPGHRNQYELMTESLLQGRLDFAYGDEEELEKLENPYDPLEREETGVKFHWDHAYYKGHYYMYFGIVPVFLAFLPYRLLTGNALPTYQATCFFIALIIAGMFSLFWLLRKQFFQKLPYGIYLALSVTFSIMSVWYASAEPTLYSTAITAAVAMELWSLFFFVRGVYAEKGENRQILSAAVGAAFGALAFGCRPPIAMANLLVLPLLFVFLKEHRFTFKLCGKLALAASPYFLTAVGLMLYNYARFEDPFEFGQRYQLTVADQTGYSMALNGETFAQILRGIKENFFQVGTVSGEFPYLSGSSVFFNFPMLLICLLGLIFIFKEAKEKKLLSFLLFLPLTVLVITAVDVMWTPYLLERYRMDVYFLMGIWCFLTLGLWFERSDRKRMFCVLVCFFCAMTLISSFLLFVEAYCAYYPEKIAEIAGMLGLR